MNSDTTIVVAPPETPDTEPAVTIHPIKYYTIQNTSDRPVANFEHGGLLWSIGPWKVNDLPSEVAEAMEKAFPSTVKIVDRDYRGTPNTVMPVDPTKTKNAQEGDTKPPPLDWSREFQNKLPPQVMAEIGVEQNVHYDCAVCGSKFPQHSLYREHLNVHAAAPISSRIAVPRRRATRLATTTPRGKAPPKIKRAGSKLRNADKSTAHIIANA